MILGLNLGDAGILWESWRSPNLTEGDATCAHMYIHCTAVLSWNSFDICPQIDHQRILSSVCLQHRFEQMLLLECPSVPFGCWRDRWHRSYRQLWKEMSPHRIQAAGGVYLELHQMLSLASKLFTSCSQLKANHQSKLAIHLLSTRRNCRL